MARKYLIYSLFLLAGSLVMSAQSDWRAPERASIANYPDTLLLYQEVSFMTDSLRQGRERGTAGHSDAAFYIGRQLAANGCKGPGGSMKQQFIVTDSTDTGANIIGIMRCAANSGRYIIVGAHYDGLGVIHGVLYPGADANASGVAAMIAISDFFSRQLKAGYTYSSNIIFVAFDSYTDGREGAGALWKAIRRGSLTDPFTGRRIRQEHITMMIDLDQMGSSMAPVHADRPDYLIAIGEHSLATASARTALDRCNRHYGLNLDLCRSYYGSANFTDTFYKLGDRKFFISGGMPVMYFTSGITPLTNKPGDTAGSLDYETLRKRVILICRFLEKTM